MTFQWEITNWRQLRCGRFEIWSRHKQRHLAEPILAMQSIFAELAETLENCALCHRDAMERRCRFQVTAGFLKS